MAATISTNARIRVNTEKRPFILLGNMSLMDSLELQVSSRNKY